MTLERQHTRRNPDDPKSAIVIRRKADELDAALADDAAAWAPFFRSEQEVIALERLLDVPPQSAARIRQLDAWNADLLREQEEARIAYNEARRRMRRLGMN